jgi:uncharacterized membrane protein YgaE (UPF0421/DUF939 family)
MNNFYLEKFNKDEKKKEIKKLDLSVIKEESLYWYENEEGNFINRKKKT